MTKKVLVTGGKGLVGKSIESVSKEYDFDFVFTDRSKHDLTKEDDVKRMFEEISPDYVIHTAARVGGIGRNLNSPAQQFYDNIMMNTLIIHYAHLSNVKKLLAFSSVCAFPAGASEIHEDILHDGAPYPAHGSYAYSKRMVDVQIGAYKQQYGVNYCSVIPGNIFGENDNFNLEDGHVVPSLIHKAFIAKRNNTPLEVWGDGSPYREFLHSSDVARACIELLKMDGELPRRIIVSGERETRISELVEMVAAASGVEKIKWLTDKPNGQLRRPTNKEVFSKYLSNFTYTDLQESITITTKWFESNYPNGRL